MKAFLSEVKGKTSRGEDHKSATLSVGFNLVRGRSAADTRRDPELGDKDSKQCAKTTDRSQLQALLKYCRTHKGKVHFVIVYNLTRFAREKYDHVALRAHLQSLGISLRSATEPIDDTSTGKLMEGVLAAFAQFDNDVRSDRTRSGMRAALELGRWTFPAPLGHLNAPKWSKTSLVHDPERGPLVRRAFEDLATGNYTKQEVIARATEAGLRSRKGLRLSPQSFFQMVRNLIYVGRVESPDYGVSTQGDFEPLVDEATFYRAQAVLDGRILVAGPRQRNHPDFPCADSCAARCAVVRSPAVGRKGGMGTTPTTTVSASAER